MARIKPIDPAESEGTNRDIFQRFLNERGKIPNMMRTVAHRPELLRTMVEHFRAVMSGGTVPPLLKELIAVRVCQLNRCEYELASHTVLARRLGATAEQFEAMQILSKADGAESVGFPSDCIGTEPMGPPPGAGPIAEEVFTPAESAALVYAEQMTRGPGPVSDEVFSMLREHFEEAEIVEITAVAGLFNYFNRFNNALEMDPTL